jgi:FkbM family methyltransferase
VEGIPELARRCARHRPRSTVVNCALVAAGHPEPTVTMCYSNLHSIVEDAEVPAGHVEAGVRSQGERGSYEVEVPARTLSWVLDEAGAPEVDLLVLDVEGYESQVLAGLDLDRHAPRFALIEALDDAAKARIDALLLGRYEEVERVTPTDVLYRRARR